MCAAARARHRLLEYYLPPLSRKQKWVTVFLFILWALTPFANRLGAAVERVVAWGFWGRKSQTSNLPNRKTQGAPVKHKKEAFNEPAPPTFND
jgi:hypothetical protein